MKSTTTLATTASLLLTSTTVMATELLLPLYNAPGTDGSAWSGVVSALTASPDLPAKLVINVSNGPGGSSPPTSDWTAGAGSLAALPNASVLGYVHCSRCERALEEVTADVDAWAAWEGGVISGIFVDEAPNDGGCAEYVAELVAHIRGVAFGSQEAPVVLNPGFPATPGALDAYYALGPTYISALETCFATSSNGDDLCDGAYTVYDSEGYGTTVDSTLRDWVGEEHYGATAVLVHGFHGTNGLYEAADPATLEGVTAALADRAVGAAVFTTNHWITPDEPPADIGSVAAAMDAANKA